MDDWFCIDKSKAYYFGWEKVFKDYDLCERANYEYNNNPNAKDRILFECFNKKDADNIKKIIDILYPNVKYYFKYFEYKV